MQNNLKNFLRLLKRSMGNDPAPPASNPAMRRARNGDRAYPGMPHGKRHRIYLDKKSGCHRVARPGKPYKLNLCGGDYGARR